MPRKLTRQQEKAIFARIGRKQKKSTKATKALLGIAAGIGLGYATYKGRKLSKLTQMQKPTLALPPAKTIDILQRAVIKKRLKYAQTPLHKKYGVEVVDIAKKRKMLVEEYFHQIGTKKFAAAAKRSKKEWADEEFYRATLTKDLTERGLKYAKKRVQKDIVTPELRGTGGAHIIAIGRSYVLVPKSRRFAAHEIPQFGFKDVKRPAYEYHKFKHGHERGHALYEQLPLKKRKYWTKKYGKVEGPEVFTDALRAATKRLPKGESLDVIPVLSIVNRVRKDVGLKPLTKEKYARLLGIKLKEYIL